MIIFVNRRGFEETCYDNRLIDVDSSMSHSLIEGLPQVSQYFP